MKREPEQILEEFLVLQAQKGDSRSIAQLVDNWHIRFVSYANRITSDAESASDVVQESWIAIINGIHRIDDPAKFKSWAFRIVHNKSYDFIRKKIKRKTAKKELSRVANRRTNTGDCVPALSGEEPVDEEIQLLRLAIRQLKPADQLILTLYYEEGLSLKDIQKITGASIPSLKSRLHHVRQRLKKTLEGKKNEQQQH